MHISNLYLVYLSTLTHTKKEGIYYVEATALTMILKQKSINTTYRPTINTPLSQTRSLLEKGLNVLLKQLLWTALMKETLFYLLVCHRVHAGLASV